MTYKISETFDSPIGYFAVPTPWDGTEHSEGDKGFLSTQKHVDIRNFRVFIETIPVPQKPDLDDVAQTVLDGETQTLMEEKIGDPFSAEAWVLTGTGLSSLVVGELSARGGWSGAVATTTGAAVNAFITSKMPSKTVSIFGMDFVSFVCPDYNTFDGASTIQFTSEVSGNFGGAGVSAAVAFSASLDPMPEFRVALSAFNAAGFDNTAITGVQINYKKAVAPSAALSVTTMAIRATKTAWTESALDFDTLLQALVVPVTIDGAPYGGSVAQAFEFVRGDGTKLDPVPADGAFYLYFQPGGQTSPNDATGSDYNKLALILREQKSIDDGTGSHIQVRLLFNDTDTNFEVANVSSTGGTPGTVTDDVIYSEVVGPALDGLKHYVLRVELRGTQVLGSLYETDITLTLGDFVWQNSMTITDESFIWRHGRVGFIADLLSRDAYLAAFDVATTGFATFITNYYIQRTPVDGVRLAAVYSPDANLFDSVSGADLFIDRTKTLSGAGSFRSQHSLTTNSFIVDDWLQTYLSLSVWVPNTVSISNQPIILVNTSTTQIEIAVPRLQPAQWNNLYFDLGLFRNLATATDYTIEISSAPNPDRSLGYFWLDNILIGRRRVAWSARATTEGPWREFRNLVNDPKGSIHFNADERGTQVQIKAVALTEDAWVVTQNAFKLFPRHAELGLPIYDQGFESD